MTHLPCRIQTQNGKLEAQIPLQYERKGLTFALRPPGSECFDFKSQGPPNLRADFFLVQIESPISLMDWGQDMGCVGRPVVEMFISVREWLGVERRSVSKDQGPWIIHPFNVGTSPEGNGWTWLTYSESAWWGPQEQRAKVSQTLEPKISRFEFCLCHIIAVGLWASHLTFLNLSFLICVMGMTIPTLDGCSEDNRYNLRKAPHSISYT